jgi:small subunit ribosomal protein S17
MQGTVVSNASDKTIIVKTEQRKSHPLYSKQYTVTKRFTVHDADNKAKAGDIVVIAEGRRRSKHKSWELQQVLESAKEGQA